MTFSKIGRIVTALVASAALGLGMTACGGGTIGYMWVIGTYYSQITGYKIDDFTGNLTAVDHSPFASGGSNPQMLVVKPGGRYLYVVNSGTGQVSAPGLPGYKAPTGTAISVFAVGSGGILTFQENYYSQGTHPIYLAFDGTGNYLYVLDQYAPDYNGTSNTNGSITAFSVAGDTGRLTLVPNQAVLKNGVPTSFFEVGPNPIMSRVSSNGCLYTLLPNEIYPYVISSGSGQLTLPTTGPQIISPSSSLTSINTGVGTSASSYVYLTDGGANQIYALQSTGTACALSPIAGSSSANVVTGVKPMNSVSSSNGKYLYVINQSQPGTTVVSQSSISAFTINSTGQLQALSTDGTNNPYAVGSGPTCIVEDPSNQYFYTSNNTDSTVTGKLWNSNYGNLADLTHGSSFSATQNPTCLAVSGNL